jgi:hypothetical protein
MEKSIVRKHRAAGQLMLVGVFLDIYSAWLNALPNLDSYMQAN